MPNLIVQPTRRHFAHLAVLLATLVLTAGAAHAHGSWEVIARAGNQDLNRLCFTDDLQGWAVGKAGTIVTTRDGGQSWDVQECPIDFNMIDIDMVDAEVGWALGQHRGESSQDYKSTVLRTRNGGGSWNVQAEFDGLYHALGFATGSRGVICGEQGKILFTSDGGESWEPARIESMNTARWSIRNVDFHSDTFGLAMGGQYDVTGVIWKTMDGGENWTHQRVAGEPVFATHAFDADNLIGVGGDLDYGAGMVTTSRAGNSWDFTDLGIWGQAEAVTFRDPFEGWVPLGFAGTYMVTEDGGNTWSAMSTPDGSAMHDAVFMSTSRGYMVGEAGTVLGYVEAGATGIGELGGVRVDGPLLAQNTPNPFRPETRIAFVVPKKADVTLKVYDSAGREVTTIVEEKLLPGEYNRDFDAAELASGVYYYRLTVDKHVETRKMVVLR